MDSGNKKMAHSTQSSQAHLAAGKQIESYLHHNPLSPENRQTLITKLQVLEQALAEESHETMAMIRSYLRFTQGEADEAEMERANEQFRELLKALGLGMLFALPFGSITLPMVVKLGQHFGIDIIPRHRRL